MTEARTRIVEIEDVGRDGDGVGRLSDGKVVFVPGTLPGESVAVWIVEEGEEYARGAVDELLEPAESRLPPECPYADRCGGCQFWHVDDDRELELKVRATRQLLEREIAQDIPEPEVVAAPHDRRYRTTVTLHCEPNREALGFHRASSREVVPIEDCLVADERIRRALEPVRRALATVGRADVKVETASDTSCVATIEPETSVEQPPESVRSVAEEFEDIGALRGMQFVCSKRPWVAGDPTVDASEVLARPPVETMRVPAGLFRQANPTVNRELVGRVDRAVERLGGGRVLELYCGAGNLAFGLDSCDSVLGLEGAEAAVEVARGAALLAQLDELSFREADLSEGYRDHVDPHGDGPFDLVLMDPPRAGATDVCRELADAPVGGLVYVSCNPDAFVRDVELLADGGWQIEALTVLDMFPRTSDVELVAVLRR
ncbi:MAG: class I SAM-dependent RNA methyltransferase [Bradymonadaceae bacterium]